MTATTTIDGMKVACSRKVKSSNTDKVGTEVAWTFDFWDCEREQILELATRSLVIDVQREYRAAKPGARKALINNHFDVGVLLNGRKKKGDPVKKAKAGLAALSQKDLADVLKMYSKK